MKTKTFHLTKPMPVEEVRAELAKLDMPFGFPIELLSRPRDVTMAHGFQLDVPDDVQKIEINPWIGSEVSNG